MTHLKRLAAPKSWIIPRKGTKYVLRPYPGKIIELSIPVGIIIRDLLKLTSSKKETRAFLKNKELLVDGKIIEEEKFPASLFDAISLPKMKKFYRLILNERGKFELESIKEDETGQKACKVIGKTSLRGEKQQLNLFNGRNIISDNKIKVNDSVLVDLQKNSIIRHLPLKEGAKAYIMGGKHVGNYGVIEKIAEKNATVKIGGQPFDIRLKNMYITG